MECVDDGCGDDGWELDPGDLLEISLVFPPSAASSSSSSLTAGLSIELLDEEVEIGPAFIDCFAANALALSLRKTGCGVLLDMLTLNDGLHDLLEPWLPVRSEILDQRGSGLSRGWTMRRVRVPYWDTSSQWSPRRSRADSAKLKVGLPMKNIPNKRIRE